MLYDYELFVDGALALGFRWCKVQTTGMATVGRKEGLGCDGGTYTALENDDKQEVARYKNEISTLDAFVDAGQVSATTAIRVQIWKSQVQKV